MARMSDRNSALAEELLSSSSTGAMIPSPPSALYPDFDIASAYAVEAEFERLRVASGRRPTGLKVGYANKAMWRVLKLETLVWAHMYDDTVHYSSGPHAQLALPHYRSPKIEPEIVFRLKSGLTSGEPLDAVEWLAIGFEMIDCPYPDWQFKPADFVAAGGLHTALVVGSPLVVTPELIPQLTEQLARFKVRLLKEDQLIEEGSGRNSLRSPALCLAELARTAPLKAGDLVSSGTLTNGQPVANGETWSVEVEDLPVPGLSVTLG
jgi:2-oxo-3-hexenedioate decarboxylase